MQQRGILIRLIDVGLIILLGFVWISDITIRAQIKLPSPTPDRKEDEPKQLIVYYLVLHRNERVSVLDPDRNPTDWKYLTKRRLEKEIVFLRNRLKEQGKQLVLLIDPEPETPMQALVDLLDICQRNHILKNIANKALEL